MIAAPVIPAASLGTVYAGVETRVVLTPAADAAFVANWTEPGATVVAAVMEIAGVDPPEETMGAVPVTVVTAPPAEAPEDVHTPRVEL
jgi:hypothetical protein